MATNSKIEWTEHTWNPVSGCTRASAGCDNCYAVSMTRRLAAMGQEKYTGLINPGKQHFNGQVRCHERELLIPLARKKPTVYFVNSMSDLFHEAVPFEFIDKVFAVMALASQHTFQVLTKRAARMDEYFARQKTAARIMTELDLLGDDFNEAGDTQMMERACQAAARIGNTWDWVLPNVWLGVSVENQLAADERIPHLLRVPAAVRFLSCEPLLGPVDLWGARYDLPDGGKGSAFNWGKGVNWVIVGGESGAGARPMHPKWVRSLRAECEAADVPFLFKQWGAWGTTFQTFDGQPAWKQFDDFQHWVNKAGRWMNGATCLDTDGNVLHIGGDFMAARDAGRFPVALLHRLGKAAAGRLLDGTLHDAMPPRP